MNKYLILLGLVLIASLSFAELPPAPPNWMQYVQYRYGCMYEYNEFVLEEIVDGCTMGEENYELLNEYLNCGMEDGPIILLDGPSPPDCMYFDLMDMYFAADCLSFDAVLLGPAPIEEGANPTMFRAFMKSFNSNNLLFKMAFNSMVRQCAAGTLEGCSCTRGEIVEDLGDARSMYQSCIRREEPYCWSPAIIGPPPIES